MTVTTSLCKAIAQARKVPGRLGLHEHTVKLLHKEWSKGQTSRGTVTTTETLLQEGGMSPGVKWLTDKQRLLGGWTDGTIAVGPFTPTFGTNPGEGWSFDELAQTAALGTSDTLQLVVQGPRVPHGQRYTVTSVERKTFGWRLMAVPSGTGA